MGKGCEGVWSSFPLHIPSLPFSTSSPYGLHTLTPSQQPSSKGPHGSDLDSPGDWWVSGSSVFWDPGINWASLVPENDSTVIPNDSPHGTEVRSICIHACLHISTHVDSEEHMSSYVIPPLYIFWELCKCMQASINTENPRVIITKQVIITKPPPSGGFEVCKSAYTETSLQKFNPATLSGITPSIKASTVWESRERGFNSVSQGFVGF